MKLVERYGLPFVTISVMHNDSIINLERVLVDTGSAGTVLSADQVKLIGIEPQPKDTLYSIRGVGGSEAVFSRMVDSISIDSAEAHDFEIQVGGMDYGFEINGILGMDFLRHTGAVINLQSLTILFSDA